MTTTPVNIYASTLMTPVETHNLLALALAMAALGFILIGDNLLKRTVSGIISIFRFRPQPQVHRSHI